MTKLGKTTGCAALVALSLALAAWPAAAQEAPAEAPAVTVKRFEATTSSERVLDLKSGVGGRVVELNDNFVEGGILEEGAAALKIEALPFELALARAEAAREEAALAYELEMAESKIAQETLAEETMRGSGRLASREVHVAFRAAALDEAKMRVKLAARDLSETAVLAPYAAVVTQEQVEKGSVVRPDDTLARLLATDTALVRIPVPASLQPRFDALVAAGHRVTVTSSAGASRDAVLFGSERTVNPRTQTIFYLVRLLDPYDLSGEHGDVIPFGSSVSVEVPLAAAADDARPQLAAQMEAASQ